MGEEVGPISGEQLRDLARRGVVSTDTLVRLDDGDWVRAETEIPGMLAAAVISPRPAPPPPTPVATEVPVETHRPTKACPYCGEEILAVAIKCKHCGSNLAEKTGGTEERTPRKSEAIGTIALPLPVWSAITIGLTIAALTVTSIIAAELIAPKAFEGLGSAMLEAMDHALAALHIPTERTKEKERNAADAREQKQRNALETAMHPASTSATVITPEIRSDVTSKADAAYQEQDKAFDAQSELWKRAAAATGTEKTRLEAEAAAATKDYEAKAAAYKAKASERDKINAAPTVTPPGAVPAPTAPTAPAAPTK